MINQDIINHSTATAKQAVLDCAAQSVELYTVSNVFDISLIDKLSLYLQQENIPWLADSPMHRQVLAWHSDTVIEELHEICCNLTDTVSTRFFDQPLNFLGIQLWRDCYPYKIKWHSDVPVINVALQVYLFSAPTDCGTSFKINNSEIAVPYQHNTGYIAVTRSQPGILHKSTTTTPPGVTRHSVYSIWSLTEKRK